MKIVEKKIIICVTCGKIVVVKLVRYDYTYITVYPLYKKLVYNKIWRRRENDYI